jgi:hypothetical protein
MRSGHNKSDVEANAKASQDYLACYGPESDRDGGPWRRRRKRQQGRRWDVHLKAGIESANLNDVLNDSKYFRVDDFVHV